MKRFSLNFSDPKIEKEFNKLKETNLAQDYNITLLFLILYVLAGTFQPLIASRYLGFWIGIVSTILLLIIGIAVKFSVTIKRHQVIGIILSFCLKIGFLGANDNGIFTPEIMIRFVVLDAFMIYTFYYLNKKERQIFLSFYEYRESFAKFKQLLTDHLPQSLTVLDLEAAHAIFSNKTFLDLFVDLQKEQTAQEVSTNPLETQNNEFMQPKIDIDSLEIDLKTIREAGKTEINLDIQVPISIRSLIKKIVNSAFLAENAWTLSASYTLPNFRKLFEVVLKKIKWDKEDAIAIILNDITYQENLIALKAADENKNKILGTVSHELRTPLNAIIGILQICEKKIGDNPEVLEHLELCQDNAYLLLSLVNSLLDLQQIGQGKLKINSSKFEVRKVMNNLLRLFQFQAKRNNIQLNLNIAEDVPAFINNDESRIKQILINLLGNAFKFTFEGSITISITQDPNYPDLLLFSVTDTGIGIKDEDKDKLFKMYGKLEDKEGVNKNGVGLGLTIANSLSALLSGKQDGKGIMLESKVGEGSKFSFQILKNLGTFSHGESSQRLQEETTKNLNLTTNNNKFKSESGTLLGTENLTEGDLEELIPFPNTKTRISDYQIVKKSLSKLGESNSEHSILGLKKSHAKDKDELQTNYDAQTTLQNGFSIAIPNENHHQNQEKLENKDILIVDDNPFNLLVAENLLKEMGYQTQTARGGKEAIEIIKTDAQANQAFKIILMDCQMPIMDGYEATKILKGMMERNEIERVPIIALTANTDQRDIERCYECGMDDFLSKPLLKDDLAEIIRKLCLNNQNEKP